MRVVVACDKFAGTLRAQAAVSAVADGWLAVRPTDTVDLAPMSDGGPGFVDVLAATVDGRVEQVATTGPHGDPVMARILWVEGDGSPVDDSPGRLRRTAYLESADCCGLHLAPTRRRPLEATADGLAVVLAAAVASGADQVVVGVGGTASTDGGQGLTDLLRAWPDRVSLVVATDVEAPLLGPGGAARSFAPQKGATAAEVDVLEARLTLWAQVAGLDPDLPGAGAGGGLAYGLMVLGARRVGGAALVAEAIRLNERIEQADLVITGEGAVDFSSLRGKVVSEVGQRAMSRARPCLVLAGRVAVGRREAASVGLDELHSIVDRVGEAAARSDPSLRLAELASAVAGQWRG